MSSMLSSASSLSDRLANDAGHAVDLVQSSARGLASDSRDGLALKFRLSEGGAGDHDPYADVFGGSQLG